MKAYVRCEPAFHHFETTTYHADFLLQDQTRLDPALIDDNEMWVDGTTRIQIPIQANAHPRQDISEIDIYLDVPVVFILTKVLKLL